MRNSYYAIDQLLDAAIVHLNIEVAGYDIYYTLDQTDLSANSTKYEETFNVA
ncbi:MAG: chitobiase/beta-hexosaminidase C-terminal domain-containing protein [Bacteroidota bacterium]